MVEVVKATHRRATRIIAALVLALLAAPMSASAAPAFAAAAHSELHAITCLKSIHCIAVGDYAPSATQVRPLVERWNGTSWSIVASPRPANTTFSRLYAVSCTSTSSCWAVGQQQSPHFPDGKPLMERWDGKVWSIVASANPPIGGDLRGVSCASPTVCVAVGTQWVTPTTCCQTFIERWNGNTWSIVGPRVPAKSSYSRLSAVTCTSASKCFAVGYFSVNGRIFTLVERWNGTAWSILASPNPGIGEGGFFNSVTCTSATNCLAAGAYNEAGPTRTGTLIERWNGKTWAIEANALPPRAYTELNGVVCANPSSCFTVGDFNRYGIDPHNAASATPIQRWNGKTWSLATSSKAVLPFNWLAGVACSSPTDCFAVGMASHDAGPGDGPVLVEHWNGTAWSAVSAPSL